MNHYFGSPFFGHKYVFQLSAISLFQFIDTSVALTIKSSNTAIRSSVNGIAKLAYPTLIIIVEGVLITLPTAIVNVVPCLVTHWTEEGLQVLEAVIGSWNNQKPTKVINVPYKFESYNELIAFRDGQI